MIGSNLVTRYNLKEAADARQLAAVENSGITTELLLTALRRAISFDPRRLYDGRGNLRKVTDLDDDTALAIQSLDIDEIYGGKGKSRQVVGRTSKVRAVDRLVAVDKAMRHLGMFENDNRQRSPSLALQVNVGAQPPRGARDEDD